jgi:CDP-diacylglycerol--glycerol-3-phosphate 3-phosphatidyltransferase
MHVAARHLLYPANLLSLLRLAMAAPITWIVARPDLRLDWLLALLMLAAIATDLADGYLSRRLGQVSDLGKILDPVADKVVIGAGVVAAVASRGFPALLVAALVYRDLLILLCGAILARRAGEVTAANRWGKLNSGVISAFCLAFLAAPAHGVTRILAWLSLAAITVSSASYFAAGEKRLFTGRPARWLFRAAVLGGFAGLVALLPAALPGIRWW